MGISGYAPQGAGPSHSRRGLGIVLVLAGAVLAVPWLVLAALCNPIFQGVCLSQPYGGSWGSSLE